MHMHIHTVIASHMHIIAASLCTLVKKILMFLFLMYTISQPSQSALNKSV